MLNHILHLWQQQRLCSERVDTEVSCLHTTSFLALKKCGQCVCSVWTCSTCCTTLWYHESHYAAFGDFLVSVLCVPNFVFWISDCFRLDGMSVWSWCEMFRDFLDCGSLAGLLGSDSMPTGNRRLFCFTVALEWNCFQRLLQCKAWRICI